MTDAGEARRNGQWLYWLLVILFFATAALVIFFGSFALGILVGFTALLFVVWRLLL